MLLAIIACVVGIVVENLKWPQDRSEAKRRFVQSEGFAVSANLLIVLVLSHSIVRWLLSFGVATMLIAVLMEVPAVHARAKAALDAHVISPVLLDVVLGLAISVVMAALSFTARWMARPEKLKEID